MIRRTVAKNVSEQQALDACSPERQVAGSADSVRLSGGAPRMARGTRQVRKSREPGGRTGCQSGNKRKRVAANATTLVLQKAGLEPAQLLPLPPQDSVSTSSTTSATKSLVREAAPLGKSFFRAFSVPAASFSSPRGRFGRRNLEHFQFAMLRISNHTACRFVEKAWLFRSLWAGRRWTPRVSPLSTLKGSTDAVSFPASRTAARCPRPCRREIPDRGISFRHLWQRAYRKSSVRPGS